MAEQSPDYKKKYLEEQRRREIAEQRLDMAERMQNITERKREIAERRQEIAERRQEIAECALEEEQRKHEEAEQSPDNPQKYLEEQCRRELAEKELDFVEQKLDLAEQLQEVAEGRRELAECAYGKEQRKREQAEQKTRKTTLLELLDVCHTYLYTGLAIQTDATLSTRGDPANANNKLRPGKITAWEDFPEQQETIWDEIMESEFVLERHFTSLHTLEESGEAIRQRMMSSRLDLHLFQRSTLEEYISSIVKQFYSNRTLRRRFQLQGAIMFENHANTLSPESQLGGGIQRMSELEGQRRRASRLQAQPILADSTDPAAAALAGTARSVGLEKPTRSSHPFADQFCVYNTSNTTHDTEHRNAAFIIDYKAPHKLPLECIYGGRGDMDLADVLREDDTSQEQFRRLIAAAITEAFSSMVQAGLEYGCVCTGEAFIFLRVPDDPRTVHCFVCVPEDDVVGKRRLDRLQLTAVGRMLVFTLQALQTPPRSHKWRAEAAAMLNKWEIVSDELPKTIPMQNASLSEYHPPLAIKPLAVLGVTPPNRKRKQGNPAR
jgi:hypothetical protein